MLDFNNLLTEDEKRNIVKQRMKQIAADSYAARMNLDTYIMMNNPDKIKECEEILKTLEISLVVSQRELNRLPASASE